MRKAIICVPDFLRDYGIERNQIRTLINQGILPPPVSKSGKRRWLRCEVEEKLGIERLRKLDRELAAGASE